MRRPLLLLERFAIRLGVALVVAAAAMGQAFEQKWPAAPPRGLEEPGEGLPDLGRVAPVDRLTPEAVRRHHVADPLDHGVRRAGGELGDAVVLADEDQRRLPERGQVCRLVEVPGLHSPVAEEHHRDLIGLAQLGRQRGAERERQVAPHHPSRPQEAVLAVDQVHRAAETLTAAAEAPHQLGHHALHRDPLGDGVTVGAVPGVDGVISSQLTADAGRDALAADAQMDEPVDLKAPLERRHPLLEAADPPHRLEQVEGDLPAERHAV